MCLRWLHQLVVSGLIHCICVQGAPESLVNFLNLFCQSRSRVFTGCTSSSCDWLSLLHLWADFSTRLWGFGFVRKTRRFGSYCCALMSLDLRFVTELHNLKISWPVSGLPHIISNSIIVGRVLFWRIHFFQVVKGTRFSLLEDRLWWRAYFIK